MPMQVIKGLLLKNIGAVVEIARVDVILILFVSMLGRNLK